MSTWSWITSTHAGSDDVDHLLRDHWSDKIDWLVVYIVKVKNNETGYPIAWYTPDDDHILLKGIIKWRPGTTHAQKVVELGLLPITYLQYRDGNAHNMYITRAINSISVSLPYLEQGDMLRYRAHHNHAENWNKTKYGPYVLKGWRIRTRIRRRKGI